MPPRKYSKSDALTGGSGDVNPQIMVMGPVTQPNPDVIIEQVFPIPRQMLPSSDGTVTVMELLKVIWDVNTIISTVAGTYTVYNGLATRSIAFPIGATSYRAYKANSAILSITEVSTVTLGAPAANAAVVVDPPIQDLTDGDGHGILVGTDNLFVTVISNSANNGLTNTGVVNVAICRIIYRWKRVNLLEYIGIVQSQQ